ncbi:MAG: hypothetical protein WBA01_09890, partial [Phormidesmis sp.]
MHRGLFQRDRKWLYRLGSFLLGITLIFSTAVLTPTTASAQLSGLTGGSGSSSQTSVGWIYL